MKEVSAGGVLVFGDSVLVLRKFNGDFVLPKGQVEIGETFEAAAIREVYEEAGVRGKIVFYLDCVHYTYRNIRSRKTVEKTVHWYLMKVDSINPKPQRSEGFARAELIPLEKARRVLKFGGERLMVEKALENMER